MRKNAFDEFNTGLRETRTSPIPPALPGMARGSVGSSGARLLQTRNSDRKELEEREFMNSPIFHALMNRFMGGV